MSWRMFLAQLAHCLTYSVPQNTSSHQASMKQKIHLHFFFFPLKNVMTQRDDMGREVGAGFRMGNTCTPVADAC